MSNQEYRAADDEVIGMVHKAIKGRPRQVGVIVSPEDAARLEAYDAEYENREADQTAAVLAQGAGMLANAGGKIGMGVLMIIGVARGLMDPFFGISMALTCVAWAVCGWKWGG